MQRFITSIIILLLFLFCFFLSKGHTMEDIGLLQAQEIAQNELERIAPQYHFVLIPGRVEEFAFGWVFGFAPKRFIETYNKDDLVPGPSELVIERDGSILALPSRPPRAAAIEETLRQWKARHP